MVGWLAGTVDREWPFSEILWPSGWALGQDMSQNDPKTTSLMTSLTKNPQPPTKKFFVSAD